MLRLARECDIKTAESRLETVGGKDVLLVKRFDRERTAKGYTRARTKHSEEDALEIIVELPTFPGAGFLFGGDQRQPLLILGRVRYVVKL